MIVFFPISTKVAAAFESVSEVLLKWSSKRSQSTILVLQHLILVLRRKSELVQCLTAEHVCSVESFHWRSQVLYSTETENMFNVLEPSSVKKLTSVLDGGLASTTQTGLRYMNAPCLSRSPGHSAKLRDCTSLVASSRSLLHSRNTVLASAAATSGLSSHELNRSREFNRSQVTPAFRSLGGCAAPMKCFVHCYETMLPYGFEYLGSKAHLFLTPQTETALLSLVRAVADRACPVVNSDSSGRSTSGKDLAVVS